MTKAISDEELQLKKRARRRLVGAIALVLLVVVFLPMFLDSEPKPLNQDIAITIPPIPNPDAAMPATADAPAVPQPEPTADAPVQTGAASLSEPEVEVPAVETPAPAPRVEAKPQTRPEPASKPAGQAAAGDAFVVQLGAFSNAANARALQRKLQENKFRAYTELVKSGGGDRTRVRVGPYPSRETADKARDQLRVRKLIIGDATVVRQGE